MNGKRIASKLIEKHTMDILWVPPAKRRERGYYTVATAKGPFRKTPYRYRMEVEELKVRGFDFVRVVVRGGKNKKYRTAFPLNIGSIFEKAMLGSVLGKKLTSSERAVFDKALAYVDVGSHLKSNYPIKPRHLNKFLNLFRGLGKRRTPPLPSLEPTVAQRKPKGKALVH